MAAAQRQRISFGQRKQQPVRAELGSVFGAAEEEDEHEQARRDYAAQQAQQRQAQISPTENSAAPQSVLQRSEEDTETTGYDMTIDSKIDSLREEGNFQAEHGNFRRALINFEEAISCNAQSAVLWELKSQIHSALDEHLEALKAASRAVELDSGWLDARLTLGRCQLSFGEIRGGVKTLSSICGRSTEAREDLIWANSLLMELRRREADFDLQLAGRAGLDMAEEEVARCKRHLLSRGKEVASDCYLGGEEPGTSDEDEEL